MNQLEKNKEELFEMMEQLAHEELSPDSIRDLATLRGAYKALCLASRETHTEGHEHHEEPVRAHQRTPQTA
ncbi:MAG: hypothetical protein HDT35_01790 [Clostridiales bacterium]|nr:hypothetical protein [Clostridiales bacterium]